jgi:hypothetical protein
MPTQEALSSGLKYAAESPLEFLKRNKGAATAGLMSIAGAMTPEAPKVPTPAPTTIRPYTYTPGYTGSERQPGVSDSSERKWFEHKFTPGTPYTPSMAGGGVVAFEDGGKVELENGGFVVPADVVSALGNGSSSAGLELLAKKLGAKPIDGPGDGMSDSIPTSIEGKRKAAVARDEAYIPADAVARAGGAAKLYEMMDRIRKHAHGKTTQQRQVNPDNLV